MLYVENVRLPLRHGQQSRLSLICLCIFSETRLQARLVQEFCRVMAVELIADEDYGADGSGTETSSRRLLHCRPTSTGCDDDDDDDSSMKMGVLLLRC